jgi:hypothetical protein
MQLQGFLRTCPLLIAMALIAMSCTTTRIAQPPREEPPRIEEPEQHGEKEPVSWEILPARGFSDVYGYVNLDFQPPDAGPGLPPGGRITIHLGRHSLDHANTVWYRFLVEENSTALLLRSGEEGIPNIKGPDGNWWSDIDLDVPSPFPDALRVTVEDEKSGLVYAFTLRRVVQHDKGS